MVIAMSLLGHFLPYDLFEHTNLPIIFVGASNAFTVIVLIMVGKKEALHVKCFFHITVLVGKHRRWHGKRTT